MPRCILSVCFALITAVLPVVAFAQGNLSIISAPSRLSIDGDGTWQIGLPEQAKRGTTSFYARWGDEQKPSEQPLYVGDNNTSGADDAVKFTHAYAVAGVYHPVFTYINQYHQSGHISTTVVVGTEQSASRYTDYEAMTPEERTAVTMLTDAGVVQGNPDGSYAPRRTLTRAEFLKIVLLAQLGEYFGEQGRDCFPDVNPNDWFAPYVCYAKNSNFVQGYPDGTFRPSKPVNYAEATKMLVNLFNYPIDPIRGEEWYLSYMRVATEQELALSEDPQPDALLTRGQMARLAAAFLAKGIVK